jgi:hypothetical protein
VTEDRGTRPTMFERVPREAREWALLVLLVAVLAGLYVVHRDVQSVRETTIVTRSVACRALVAGGVELDPAGPCLEPEILEHYDPTTVETSRP